MSASLWRLTAVAAVFWVKQSAAANIGLTWEDCTVSRSVDADSDGLDDHCEVLLAQAFAPVLRLHVDEPAAARRTYWAARKNSANHVRVFYALSYLNDMGHPMVGSLFPASWQFAHYGDSEFIVVDVRSVGVDWVSEKVFLSSHFGSTNDRSVWVPSKGDRPTVVVSLMKHANFATTLACRYACLIDVDAGVAAAPVVCADVCMDDQERVGREELVDVKPERNLGTMGCHGLEPILAARTGDDCPPEGICEHEWYWQDVRFCGWQVQGVDEVSRGCDWKYLPNPYCKPCVQPQNSYLRQLTALDMAGLGQCSDAGPETADAADDADTAVVSDAERGDTSASDGRAAGSLWSAPEKCQATRTVVSDSGLITSYNLGPGKPVTGNVLVTDKAFVFSGFDLGVDPDIVCRNVTFEAPNPTPKLDVITFNVPSFQCTADNGTVLRVTTGGMYQRVPSPAIWMPLSMTSGPVGQALTEYSVTCGPLNLTPVE